MACPYFMPVAKLKTGNWPHPARLPLGCGWTGHCTAPEHEGETPPPDLIEDFCNLGYAGSCSWAPPQRQWDAVRFALAAPQDSEARDKPSKSSDSSGRILHLIYVCERDHLPALRGDLEFDLASSTWAHRHGDPRIQKMAECFLETYLKKKA